MADFDLDDPLGDLLSDGSNDSFFDPKPKKSSNPPPEKKTVKDLFNLDKNEPKKSELKKSDDWLGLSEPKKPLERVQNSPTRLKQTKKISFEDDNDDVLSSLGLEKKKEEKQINLMESILGKKEEKSTLKGDSFGFSSLDAPRRSRQQQPSRNLDPLGLLSIENKLESAKKIEKPSPKRSLGSIEGTSSTEILFPVQKQRDLKTKSAPNISELPNWLENKEKEPIKSHKSDSVLIQSNNQETEIEVDKKHEEIKDSKPTTPLQKSNLDFNQENNPFYPQFEYQTAAITMKQQESQILMALQIKKYDENLVQLQRKQQELLNKQEQQFNDLLEKQYIKQQIIENNLKLQQEKINNHIQTMLSQPFKHDFRGENEVDNTKKNEEETKNEQINEIVKSIKDRSREEMFLLEESYKKQISTLEQTMDSIENRLKSEITNLNEAHQRKCEELNNEHESELKRYKGKLEEIVQIHNEEIKNLRDNHNRIIEEIKYEYQTMIDNIKQNKQTEQILFQNASDYSEKLNNNIKLLNSTSTVLFEVKNKVDYDFNVVNQAKEETLKAKEKEIELMKEALEKSRESTELERSQLLALIRNLEIKIAEQSQNEREERWALQQATAIFTARSKALDRETEYNRTALEREREEIKTLKDTLLGEQEKLILQLTEERLALATERKRFETQSKLSQNYDSQKGKAELEAAIQVAKEAAEMTDRERDVLYKQQAELESLKRVVIDREKKVSFKEKDLEGKIKETLRKSIEGEKAIEDAKTLERNVNNRMREIQMQLNALAGREKKLADEKIAMSKERLKLNNELSRVKKCSLCSAGELGGRFQENDENSEVEQDFPQFTTASDPDLLRLRMKYTDGENFNKNLFQDFNST
ncbi:fas-binding factor 1 homolog [Onthophagus taurus]|uniref:fas-binding factor 1 homolog n=1 Tax=Onthophagus taurus TaxID=166361 RepID=UPI0039BEC5A7